MEYLNFIVGLILQKNFVTSEDVFILFLMLSFTNFILSIILSELIWPSQFFNRRHSTGLFIIRNRSFSESFLKLIKFKSLNNSIPFLFYNKICSDYVIN